MEKVLGQLEKLILPSSDKVFAGSLSEARCLFHFDLCQDASKFYPPSMKLVEVLMGITPPSDRTPIKGISFFDPTLNDSQKEAVRFALESPEVACIHGPPGILSF
jgi:DNA polymerase alpha-associated DNA helicase A